MQLSEVADRLYALVPDDFTEARDTAAREARAAGDKELAAALKQLRRPPAGAWAVNALVRDNLGDLDDFFDLGAELREAQQALAGDDLRALSRRRHRVIAELTERARALVAAAGHQLADAAAREVGATLEAALADEQAAAVVRSGRLMRPLTSTGLEAVDLTGAVAAPEDIAALPRRPARVERGAGAGGSGGGGGGDGAVRATRADRAGGSGGGADRPPRVERTDRPGRGGAARRDDRKARLATARAQARSARRTADDAEKHLATAQDSVDSAHSTLEEAAARIAELTAALHDAKADHSAAESDARRAGKQRDDAAHALESAGRAADRADATLARLPK